MPAICVCLHVFDWSEDERNWGPTCSYIVKEKIRGMDKKEYKNIFLSFQLSEATDWNKQPLLTTHCSRSIHHKPHQTRIQEVTQWIHSTGNTPVNLDQCERTCGQYEGLRGSRRERGRGVIAVQAVWVKKVRGQMRSNVNSWPQKTDKTWAVKCKRCRDKRKCSNSRQEFPSLKTAVHKVMENCCITKTYCFLCSIYLFWFLLICAVFNKKVRYAVFYSLTMFWIYSKLMSVFTAVAILCLNMVIPIKNLNFKIFTTSFIFIMLFIDCVGTSKPLTAGI